MLDYRGAENHIRVAFWTVGIVVGGLITYLTRYYLNTDGLIYLEIGDAVRRGSWGALVNHHWSPGYSVIMAFAQWWLNTTVHNELTSLKAVNFFIFIAAMAACEVFIKNLRASLSGEPLSVAQPAPFGLVQLALYSAFLVAALVWIRIRLVSPDMLMFAYMMLLTSLIFRIKNNPDGFSNFLLLGCTLGLAYLTKTYMFVYSWIVIALAALAVGSLKKAVVRVGVAMLVMMAFCTPLVISLSRDLGRFTYGEAGNYNYALFVASHGEVLKPPKQLTSKPEELLFEEVVHSSFSPGADIAKRSEGKRPRFDLGSQIRAIERNLSIIVLDSPWLLLAVLVWSVVQLRWAMPQFRSVVPPSETVTLLAISTTGVLMFALVLVEMRYIAPFLFAGFAGLIVLWGYKPLKHREMILRNYSYYAICLVFLTLTAGSVIDQGRRAICSSSSKQAYESLFREDLQIAQFINAKTPYKGVRAGVVESPRMSIYWARLAGARIVAEIPSVRDYLDATPEERGIARRKLSEHSVAFVVARGSEFGRLRSEGWEKIPTAFDYYMLFTNNSR